MSILDDAIREHLELKRAHGADEAELKRLEDEAFGPPGRPDDASPFAEAPTEFLGAPAIDAKEAAEEAQGRRAPNITDLQEAPPPPKEPEAEEAEDEDIAPAAEEQTAMEHETIPVPHPELESEPEPPSEPEAAAGPSTEEREVIADQPTQFFDVEAEMESGAEKPSPTDEQLLDSQLTEPRLAPVEPLDSLRDTGPDAEVAREDALEDDDEDDEFFSEQRLSEELNNALDAPVTEEHEAVYVESEGEGEEGEDDEDHESPYEPATGSHDDVLEDTPEFLEDAPDDDDLWFEQKPPKDFDLD